MRSRKEGEDAAGRVATPPALLAFMAISLGFLAPILGGDHAPGDPGVAELSTELATGDPFLDPVRLGEWIRDGHPMTLIDLRPPEEFREFSIPTSSPLELASLRKLPVPSPEPLILVDAGGGGAARACSLPIRDVNRYVYYMGKRGRGNPEETRQRIVEASVALHQELGPADTTITAIAERAGVQRLTVYRHFPEEADVLRACSSHWRDEHPLPDSAEWAGLQDPAARLQAALDAVFLYFRNGRDMLAKVLRDEKGIQALSEIMEPYHAWFRELAAQLSAGWGTGPEDQRFIRAAVGHALQFSTWESLVGQGLSDTEAAEALTRLVACLADRPLSGPPTG